MNVFILIFFFIPSLLIAEGIPNTLIMRGNDLVNYKKLIKSDKLYRDAWKSLQAYTDKTLGKPTYTVTSKPLTPDSGDKRDYMSFGPYWWPNPKTENGLPYIRKDGQINLELRDDRADQNKLSRLIKEVNLLSVAYYLGDDERYAQRAVKLIDTWFINSKTKMDPNLNYGQAIPGKTKGRGIGIIETRHLGKIVDALILLEKSPKVDEGIISKTKEWLSAYLNWLLTSKNGIDESNTQNNHATWYDVQVAVLALYCQRPEVAAKTIERVKNSRLEQIADDGTQPHELKRTRSFDYSEMNLEGFLILARLAEHTTINLWSAGNQRILKATLFLEIHTHDEWPYKQIKKYDYNSLFGVMKLAAIYKNKQVNILLERIKHKAGIDLLLY